MPNKRIPYITNYFFVIALAFFVLNDHFLKWNFHNWITGKLSDILGILILPLLILGIFPKINKIAPILITCFFFIFWKSPFSTPFIGFYNEIALIPITRIVDYSDLYCLIPLIGLFWVIRYKPGLLYKLQLSKRYNWQKVLILFGAFSLMATSPPLSFYHKYTNAPIYLNGKVKVNLTKDEILAKLEQKGLSVIQDTFLIQNDSIRIIYSKFHKRESPYFLIEKFIFGLDTIENISFSIYPRRYLIDDEHTIFINGLYDNPSFDNLKSKRTFRRTHQRLLKEKLFRTLNE